MDNGDAKTIKGEWLSVIFLILLQMGISIWWAAKVDERVKHLESQANKGSRFTAGDGIRLGLAFDVEQRAQRQLLQDHIDRTEPILIEIHDYVIEDRIKDKYRE